MDGGCLALRHHSIKKNNKEISHTRSRPVRAKMADHQPSSSSSPSFAALCTFDVDGTLIRSVGADSNRMHKDAFATAFQVVYGIEADIDEINHHGSTDVNVIVDVMKHKGLEEDAVLDKIEQAKRVMVEYVQSHSSEASKGLDVLPGVPELLQCLRDRNVKVGLVTGNLQVIAWAKMEALGIKSLFSEPTFGGFGSDDRSRAKLVTIAKERAGVVTEGGGDSSCKRYHFGDTPNDIKAAAIAGAVPVGVATGAFSVSELLAAAAEVGAQDQAVVFESFVDTQSVLDKLALP